MNPEPRKITFHEFVGDMHDGAFVRELEAKHKEALAHLMNKRGKAEITLKFTYTPAGDNGVNIQPAPISLKLPAKSMRAEFVYADDNGQSYLDDPNQAEFPFTIVPGGSKKSAAGQ